MIRVLLAEDQGLVRGALATLLGLEADITVIAEVSRGDEVLPAARRTHPDVALLDIEMPGGDGLEAAAVLRREVPACRVVILTTFARPGFLWRAMAAGAVGFLLKDGPASELARAIRRVMEGYRIVDPSWPPPLWPTALARSHPGAGGPSSGEGRCDRRRHRLHRPPLSGDDAQPSVDGNPEARRSYPHRRTALGGGEGLALTG